MKLLDRLLAGRPILSKLPGEINDEMLERSGVRYPLWYSDTPPPVSTHIFWKVIYRTEGFDLPGVSGTFYVLYLGDSPGQMANTTCDVLQIIHNKHPNEMKDGALQTLTFEEYGR